MFEACLVLQVDEQSAFLFYPHPHNLSWGFGIALLVVRNILVWYVRRHNHVILQISDISSGLGNSFRLDHGLVFLYISLLLVAAGLYHFLQTYCFGYVRSTPSRSF